MTTPHSDGLTADAAGWFPIETVPKDTDVLLARQTSDGRWVMELIWTGRSNRHSGGYSDAWVHTHWRPLPPPPGAVPNTPVITDPVVTDEMVEAAAVHYSGGRHAYLYKVALRGAIEAALGVGKVGGGAR